MARFTNIGMPRKRHVASAAEEARAVNPQPEAEAGPSEEPAVPKKKTHRGGYKLKRKRERAAEAAAAAAAAEQAGATVEGGGAGGVLETAEGGEAGEGTAKRQQSMSQGWGRNADIAQKAKVAAQRSEVRRLQRLAEKQADLTCFACRAKGHSARDCPNVLLAAEGGLGSAAMLEGATPVDDADASSGAQSGKGKAKKGAELTGGRCYRCNGDHSLSACRKRPDPSNPTPYATCFVCLSQGHLSSQCPQNARGVYVNGGACKICGSVKHRAKDCPKIRVREEDMIDELGGGRQGYREAGADEDDWMVRPREDGGKKRKHAPANNGLREKHRKEGVTSATASGEASSASGAKGPAKPKKVVAF